MSRVVTIGHYLLVCQFSHPGHVFSPVLTVRMGRLGFVSLGGVRFRYFKLGC